MTKYLDWLHSPDRRQHMDYYKSMGREGEGIQANFQGNESGVAPAHDPVPPTVAQLGPET